MGCGASGSSSKYRQATTGSQQEQLEEQLRRQSEQIALLVKGQHQLAQQLSLLIDRLPPSDAATPLLGRAASKKPTGGFRVRESALQDHAAATDGAGPLQLSAVPLAPAIQNYAWGRDWQTSLVSQLCEGPQRQLDRSLRYAEMWMGTHPSGPSTVRLESADGVAQSPVGLKAFIEQNPEYWLGKDAARRNLPFLLKVLSVGQALSIQAHPHRKLAKYLHDTFPDRYKDPNHKPEIALPLGAFEALVAFRPFAEVQRYIESIEELRNLCGFGMALSLKDLYARLMRSDGAAVAKEVKSLVRRLGAKDSSELTPEEALVLRLNRDYPGDVGIFSVFFLNYVRIADGERNRFIFCAPDEPHAYLSGDCVECMSLSDNVVRAGLTPKFKDVETLLGMLTYRDDRLDTLVNEGRSLGRGVTLYDPPVEDFMVYQLDGGPGDVPEPLELPNASICICTSGSFGLDFCSAESQVEEVRRGQSFFVRAGTRLEALRCSAGSKLFVATRS